MKGQYLGKPYLFTFKTKAMRNVRLIVAVSLMLSLMAVTSVAYAYASDHSPGVQHELVMQMTIPYDATQTFEPVHPGEAAVPFGVPPCESEGITKEVEARCNSPG